LSIAGAIIGLMLFAAPSALAWQYHLPFYKAENIAKGYVKGECAEEDDCVAWGVHCTRVSQQRVLCGEGIWHEVPYELRRNEGETLLCRWIGKYGIGPGGYITETFTKSHCEYVQEG
jgi:hypothetical protein